MAGPPGDYIPIVDFEAFNLQKDVDQVNEDALKDLAQQLYKAFHSVGFVYLKNHGISDEQVKHIFQLSSALFSLSKDEKNKYLRPHSDTTAFGYVPPGREYFDATKPADLKESFDIVPGSKYDHLWPDGTAVPNFKSDVLQFHQTCAKLALRILKVIGLGLGLEDINFFASKHASLGVTADGNPAILRLLNYPRIPSPTEILPDQSRCGEHTDYGSMTLLFQDDAGGLEVQKVDGSFVPATPVPGTIVVNIADMMQRWTANRLKSTVHRVVIPQQNSTQTKARQSIAFFVDPDGDTMVECIDGSNKYTPIKYIDYLNKRFSETGMYAETNQG